MWPHFVPFPSPFSNHLPSILFSFTVSRCRPYLCCKFADIDSYLYFDPALSFPFDRDLCTYVRPKFLGCSAILPTNGSFSLAPSFSQCNFDLNPPVFLFSKWSPDLLSGSLSHHVKSPPSFPRPVRSFYIVVFISSPLDIFYFPFSAKILHLLPSTSAGPFIFPSPFFPCVLPLHFPFLEEPSRSF